MIRAVVILFASGLLLYPVFCLLSLEAYRIELEELHGAAEASVGQLQSVAAIHWLKNAYLAFAFLLLARFLGNRQKPRDVRLAGILLTGLPVVEVLWQTLAQIAMNQQPEGVSLNIQLTADFMVYSMFGLVLIGLARVLLPSDREESEA